MTNKQRWPREESMHSPSGEKITAHARPATQSSHLDEHESAGVGAESVLQQVRELAVAEGDVGRAGLRRQGGGDETSVSQERQEDERNRARQRGVILRA